MMPIRITTSSWQSNNLPRGLLAEILARLPTKSLVRFKCVCRTWHDLVEDHPFLCDLHLACSKKNPYRSSISFLGNSKAICIHATNDSDPDNDGFERKASPASVIQLKLPPKNSSWISSCNGLLCFSSSKTLHVSNPITGECLSLPQSPLESCYTSRSSVHYSIGFDFSTGCYKVVRIFSKHGSPQKEIEICTLGERSLSWRYIGKIDYQSCGGLCVDGTLHWWMDFRRRTIVTMDMGSEGFDAIELPDMAGRAVQMLEWKGCLAVLEYVADSCTNMWVLEDDKSPGGEDGKKEKKKSWTKKLSIAYQHQIQPLCMQKNGEILVMTKNHKLFSYSPKSQTRSSAEFVLPFKLGSDGREVNYVPSLVKLGGKDEIKQGLKM